MFEQFTSIFLQKKASFKTQKVYNITSGNNLIGTIEETSESTKNLGNTLLELIGLFNIVSLDMKVCDVEGEVFGRIKKAKGFYNDFQLFSADGKHLVTIKSNLKLNSSSMTVIDHQGQEIVKAIGGYGATDFIITDCQNDKEISSLKRRSYIYKSVKENLLNDDGYYIDNNELESTVLLSLLAMGVILDMYYFKS